MASRASTANATLSLNGKLSAVAGGTQGIGEGIARRLAQAGSSVVILGRNEEAAHRILADLKAQSPNDTASFDFIRADLTLRSEIKRAADELEQKAGSAGVSYFFQTQGMTPNGKWELTSEGIESRFALQVLSKFGLLYYLTKRNVIKEAIVSIGAPGGSTKAFDATDVGLAKAKAAGSYGLFKSAERDGLAMDSVTQEFQDQYPALKFYHAFPGLVNTNAIANAGLPTILQWGAKLAGSILGTSPAAYAEFPVYLATSQPEPRFWATFKVTNPNSWIQDKSNRSAVFDNLLKTLQGETK